MLQEKCQHKLVKPNGNNTGECLDCSSTVLLDTGYASIGLVKNGLYRRNDGIQSEVEPISYFYWDYVVIIHIDRC